jgi:CRISPR/Cas system-associated endonuclease Cas3-HD
MKPVFEDIMALARPYLDTRENDIHTAISLGMACRLMILEGGDEDIIIPAIILHDVGWKTIPENMQRKAFGPKATLPELNRRHELAGAEIARRLLEQIGYAPGSIDTIAQIIEGHDSRTKALSLEDKIVKDADKLWRYTREGFDIDVERFQETPQQVLTWLESHLHEWFFTKSGQQIASAELKARKAGLS